MGAWDDPDDLTDVVQQFTLSREDTNKADPIEDMRALAAELLRPQPYRPMPTYLSVADHEYVRENPKSPCCGVPWWLEGYISVCPKCLVSVAQRRTEYETTP